MSLEKPPISGAQVEGLHDPITGTVTYIVWDCSTRTAAVIDPVLDYEPRASSIGAACLKAVTRVLDQHHLRLRWILETHVHADHLSAAAHLQSLRGGEVCIGSGAATVREQWTRHFPDADPPGHPAFDRLLDDGAELELGDRTIRVMHTPGHTPSCVTYLVDDAAFVGDTLFMPDAGTARCDFPGASARDLYRSIRKILELPATTRLFTAHDYGRPGGEAAWSSTVGEQRRSNVHVRDGVSEDDYVELRTARDRGLEPPALMWAAVQVNLRGGRLPEPDRNGVSYLRVPVNVALDDDRQR